MSKPQAMQLWHENQINEMCEMMKDLDATQPPKETLIVSRDGNKLAKIFFSCFVAAKALNINLGRAVREVYNENVECVP